MASPHLYVKGIHEPDEEFQQMRAVYDACVKASVAVPDPVAAFFDWQPPDARGTVVDLDLHESVKSFNEEMREGFDVDLSKLPKNLTHLRFYISW